MTGSFFSSNLSGMEYLRKDFINMVWISVHTADDSTGRLFGKVAVLVVLSVFTAAIHAQQMVVLPLTRLRIQIGQDACKTAAMES